MRYQLFGLHIYKQKTEKAKSFQKGKQMHRN